jgi:hypothetical protein
VAGAKSTVAAHVAKALTDAGHGAEVRGHTIHLKDGSKIEIGNKGERTYYGTGSKVAEHVEGSLKAHPEKHVRTWAGKTEATKLKTKSTPAESKARTEARAQRAAERTEKTKARAAQKVERTAAKQARAKATAERKASVEAKRTEKIGALREIGAPATASGSIDATKVPGARKDWKPPTSSDPENSYKGRSYTARSKAEMVDELLRAPSVGGQINDGLAEDAQGGTKRKLTGGELDAVNEKYETSATTIEEAIAVVAKASAVGGKRPDWRHFDIDVLREIPGLEKLQLPEWVHEAKSHEDEKQHLADYYREAGDGGFSSSGATPYYDEPDHDTGHIEYHPPGAGAEVPF